MTSGGQKLATSEGLPSTTPLTLHLPNYFIYVSSASAAAEVFCTPPAAYACCFAPVMLQFPGCFQIIRIANNFSRFHDGFAIAGPNAQNMILCKHKIIFFRFGPVVQRLRHRVFIPATGVRLSAGSPQETHQRLMGLF